MPIVFIGTSYKNEEDGTKRERTKAFSWLKDEKVNNFRGKTKYIT